jgi:ribosomal protein S18 acetylase RimI-like enzyme
MSQAIRVRQIQPWEGAALRDMRLRAISDKPDAFAVALADTLAQTDEGWTRWATVAAMGDTHIIYVAEDAGTWIGIVGGMRGASDVEEIVEEVVDLISLWVDPAYRGRGLGRQLIEQVVVWARDHGVRRLELWVTEHNATAIDLYTRSGFKKVGETQPFPSDASLREQRMMRDL